MLRRYQKDLQSVTEEMKNIALSLLKANRVILGVMENANQNNCPEDTYAKVKEHLKNIAKKTVEIDNKIVVMLARFSPEARDLRTLVAYLKINNEYERLATNTRNLMKGLIAVCPKIDTQIVRKYAVPMHKETVKALEGIVGMIETDCIDEVKELFNQVVVSESKTDDFFEILEENVLKVAKENIETFKVYHKLLTTLRKSEKIADRVLSIASLLLFAKVGGEINH